MQGESLEEVAAAFDEVYTQLTLLQRRLITAGRAGQDDAQERELLGQAKAVIAAYRASKRADEVSARSPVELEAIALRERVLTPPLDGHLLMAAARSQNRAEAYPILADALAQSVEQHAIEQVWEERTVATLLGSPRAMGPGRARALADHYELSLEATMAEIGDSGLARLIEVLRESAVALPEALTGQRKRPKPPEDGTGGGTDVLMRWVDASGAGTDPVRRAAYEASQREGWPADAVPVAEILVEFNHRKLLPGALEGFGDLVDSNPDQDELLAALRAEERRHGDRWRFAAADDSEAEAGFALQWLYRTHVEALGAVRKAREKLGEAPAQWRGPPPLALARTAARRCGQIIGGFVEPDLGLIGQLLER